MLSDLKSAARQLMRVPLHTAAVVAILAIGIGANAAIFSLVRAIFLKPLPYPEPEQVMFLMQQQRGSLDSPFSWPNIQDVAHDNRSFSAVGAYSRSTMTISGRGAAEQCSVVGASADYFQVIGIRPILGRVYAAAEDSVGGPKVVVLKESFWRRKLGGDPGIIGQTIALNSQPYEVIGILPNSVMNPTGTDVWVPLGPWSNNDSWQNRRNQPGLFAFARLKPGVTVEQAQADVNSIGLRLQKDFPEANSNILPVARPLLEIITSRFRGSLTMLGAAVGLLLLVVCANVASLQLVRGFARLPELSVRSALGAGRSALARLLFYESALLSLLGGVLGVALAIWSLDGIRAFMPPTPRLDGLAVDGSVLAFSAGLALLTATISGLWPAWKASRIDLADALQAAGQKGTIGRTPQLTRQAMVAMQVMLTVVLLSGAGLFARSLRETARFQFGFDPSNLLLVAVNIPDSPGAYDSDEKRIAFFERVRSRVSELPGVESAGLNYSAPLRMDWSQIFDVDGRPAFPAGQEPVMEMGIIDEHYFATLGLPILKGRNFDPTDRLGGTRSIIIDQRMAETLWPGEDPVGKVILRGNSLSNTIEKRRTVVVGVVPTIAVDGVTEGPRFFQGYLAQSQTGSEELNLIVRTSVSPRSLVEPVRAALTAEDPNVPAHGIATMEELISRESDTQRLYALLTGMFAFAALSLSALGLYGIVAQAVGTRRREIGIRMALGAVPKQVVALVFRQGAASLAAGLLLGMCAAAAGGRLVAGLLYHVSPLDPLTLVTAPTLLLITGFVALWLPARRASRIDPAACLRSE